MAVTSGVACSGGAALPLAAAGERAAVAPARRSGARTAAAQAARQEARVAAAAGMSLCWAPRPIDVRLKIEILSIESQRKIYV